MLEKQRGTVRFHQIRDFKQYYLDSIPPTSDSMGRGGRPCQPLAASKEVINESIDESTEYPTAQAGSRQWMPETRKK